MLAFSVQRCLILCTDKGVCACWWVTPSQRRQGQFWEGSDSLWLSLVFRILPSRNSRSVRGCYWPSYPCRITILILSPQRCGATGTVTLLFRGFQISFSPSYAMWLQNLGDVLGQKTWIMLSSFYNTAFVVCPPIHVQSHRDQYQHISQYVRKDSKHTYLVYTSEEHDSLSLGRRCSVSSSLPHCLPPALLTVLLS